MTTETVLTNDQIIEQFDLHIDNPERFRGSRDFARAIEKAVLQSEQVRAWKRDAGRWQKSLDEKKDHP